MSFPFQLDPFSETYEDVRKLLSFLVRKFTKRYDLDQEEARSLANLAFVRAYHSYELEKGTFSSWVAHKVWKYLLSGLTRKKVNQERPVKFGYDLDRFRVPDTPEFRLDDFLTTLKEDAQEVVRMALEPPKQVKKIVKGFGSHSDVDYRMAMRQYLRDKGWTQRRIAETFKEVRRAL